MRNCIVFMKFPSRFLQFSLHRISRVYKAERGVSSAASNCRLAAPRVEFTSNDAAFLSHAASRLSFEGILLSWISV